MNDPMENQQQEAQMEEPIPLPPQVRLTVSGNRMQLELMLIKSGEETLPPVYEDLMAQIAAEGVVYGINEGVVQALCDSPVFNRSIVVAKGLPPSVGKDGELHYLVEERKEFRPKERADGTVDYRDLGFTQNVAKGQTLCEIHPPEKGADGSDIFGNTLEGILGKEPMNPSGKNTVVSDDGSCLTAACDGSAEIVRGVINVLDVLRINGNIDNGTGDIIFAGDLTITGDVLSGFRVMVKGNITVMGSVEGATVEATGNIVVGGGINGMNRGSVSAGGDIRCKYIQSCFMRAEGNIYADTIMYCTLECGGNVELSGKKGCLIGGRSSLSGKLSLQTIGTDSHIATHITMASTGVRKNQEILELSEEMKRLELENRKLLQVMARYDDLKKQGRLDSDGLKVVLQAKDQYIVQVKQLADLKQKQEQIKREQLEASRENSYILCKGRIHAGVQLVFGPLTMQVHTSFVNSRVSIVGDEITVSTL